MGGDLISVLMPLSMAPILRAMLNGTRMGKPQQVLLDWREHENRLTHTDKRYHRRAFVAQSAVRAFFAKQGWVEGSDYIMGG